MGALLSSGMATTSELNKIGLEGAHDLLDVLLVREHNRRILEKP